MVGGGYVAHTSLLEWWEEGGVPVHPATLPLVAILPPVYWPAPRSWVYLSTLMDVQNGQHCTAGPVVERDRP